MEIALDVKASFPGHPASDFGAKASACTDVTILVCRTCRHADGAEPAPGAVLAEETARLGREAGVRVSSVACLGNCKRRLSAAILKPGAWNYVFGDLAPSAAQDLLTGALLLSSSPDGLLPWRGRPESLKRGLVARIPSLDLIGFLE